MIHKNNETMSKSANIYEKFMKSRECSEISEINKLRKCNEMQRRQSKNVETPRKLPKTREK